jgi:hypothetical protein
MFKLPLRKSFQNLSLNLNLNFNAKFTIRTFARVNVNKSFKNAINSMTDDTHPHSSTIDIQNNYQEDKNSQVHSRMEAQEFSQTNENSSNDKFSQKNNQEQTRSKKESANEDKFESEKVKE